MRSGQARLPPQLTHMRMASLLACTRHRHHHYWPAQRTTCSSLSLSARCLCVDLLLKLCVVIYGSEWQMSVELLISLGRRKLMQLLSFLVGGIGWLRIIHQCSSLLSSPSWFWLICLIFYGSRARCPNIRKKIMIPKINHWNTEFGSTVFYSRGDGVGC